jgi:hypothetical protein
MDSKSRDLLVAAGWSEGDIYRLDPWGDADLRGSALPVTRDDLGRYRLVVWNVEGAAGSIGNVRTALVNAIGCGNRWLPRYLKSGGAVWIHGTHVLAAASPRSYSASETGCVGLLANDHRTGQDVAPGDFLCQFMMMCGGNFYEVRTETSKSDGLLAAIPTSLGAGASLPPLEADSTAYNYQLLGGIRYVDAQFGVIVPDPGLEPLYTMKAVRANSTFNNRNIAWRYMDPDPDPDHGPMAVFFFNLHEMKPGSAEARTGARGLARSLGEWFRSYLAAPGTSS